MYGVLRRYLLFLAIFCLYSPPACLANLFTVTHIQTLRADMVRPSDVSIYRNGYVYVVDGVNGRVVVFNSAGKMLFTFGRPGSGRGELKNPMGIYVDEKSVYVADTMNHRIAVFDRSGVFLKNIYPAHEEGWRWDLPEPVDVVVRGDTIFWTDRRHHLLCTMDRKGLILKDCYGGKGSEEGRFVNPLMISTDKAGYVYVVDVLNGRIQFFDRRGQPYGVVSGFGILDGELFRPFGVTIDGYDRIYVTDSFTGRVSLFHGGVFEGYLSGREGIIEFLSPGGLSIWKDRIYVVDMAKNTVEVFSIRERDQLDTQNRQPKRTIARKKGCTLCHLSWHPYYRHDDREKVLPVASPRMCYSCHNGSVVDSRDMFGKGYNHPTIHDKKRKGSMERGDDVPDGFPLIDGRLYCGSCHTPHYRDGIEKQNHWLRKYTSGGTLCKECHISKFSSVLSQRFPRDGTNHPVDISLMPAPEGKDGERYASIESLKKGLPHSLKQKGARLGSGRQMICETCHGIHGTSGKKLLVVSNKRDELCILCHEDKVARGTKEAQKKGTHPIGIYLVDKKGRDRKKEFLPRDRYLKDGLPEGLKRSGAMLGEDGEMICRTCHHMHGGKKGTKLLVEDHVEGRLCMFCHRSYWSRDRDDARRKGTHPVGMYMRKREGKGRLYPEDPNLTDGIPSGLKKKGARAGKKERITCATCHVVHSGKGNGALLVKERDGLCVECHVAQAVTDQDEAEERGIHPVNTVLKEAVEIVGKRVERITCTTCHRMHRAKKGDSLLSEDIKDGRLCIVCHEDKKKVLGSDHDLRITAKNSSNRLGFTPELSGVCGVCHTIHGGKPWIPFLFAGRWKESSPLPPQDRICLSCHKKGGWGEKKIVKYYTHPSRDLIFRSRGVLPLFNEDMERDEFGQIRCVTCHDPHIWSRSGIDEVSKDRDIEGNVLSSFLRTDKLKDVFCVDCHGLETIIKYKYYHDSLSRGDVPGYLKGDGSPDR